MFCVPTESQVKKNQAIIAGVQGGGLGSKQLSLRHFRQDDFWFPAISRSKFQFFVGPLRKIGLIAALYRPRAACGDFTNN